MIVSISVVSDKISCGITANGAKFGSIGSLRDISAVGAEPACAFGSACIKSAVAKLGEDVFKNVPVVVFYGAHHAEFFGDVVKAFLLCHAGKFVIH